MSKNLLFVTIGLCFLVILVGEGIVAQHKVEYPAKPINIIVPFGGGLNFSAHVLEQGLAEELKQPVNVFNRLGGGGTDGWNELVGSAADGYTIGISAPELLLHTLYKTGNYHYLTALEPLSQIAVFPYVLVVDAKSPWQSLEELAAYGRGNSGQIKYGHRGIGSMSHMMGAALGKETGFSLTPVPFKSNCESIRALHSGHVQVMFADPSVVKEEVANGRLRVIAVTGTERMRQDVFSVAPTLQELGLDLVFEGWVGVVVPQEMESDVKAKLICALQNVIADPELASEIQKMNMEISYLDSASSKEKWLKEYYYMKEKLAGSGVIEEIKAQQQE